MRQSREDILCNRLIDLYLREKEIMGCTPADMPRHNNSYALAALCAAPTHPIQFVQNTIHEHMLRLQDNMEQITRSMSQNLSQMDSTVQAQLWFGIGILGLAALLGRMTSNEGEKLHHPRASVHGRHYSILQEIDLERYHITKTNPDIFPEPHYRYHDTPKRYAHSLRIK